MRRLSLLFLVLSFFQTTPAIAGGKVCSVAVKITSAADAISKQELSSLKKYVTKKISKNSTLEIVSPKDSEYFIAINLLDTDDLHGPDIKNAMASLSLYTASDMKMFLYSQHFGKRSKKASLAWGEKNFQRAINFALQAYVRSCDQLLQLSEE